MMHIFGFDFFCFWLLLLVSTSIALDTAKLCEGQIGFSVCINETHWIRCMEAEQPLGTCDIDTVCLCGRMSAKWSTPCGFDFATLSDDCEGRAGDFIEVESDLLDFPHEGTILGPTDHVPLALLVINPSQWRDVVAWFIDQDFFDDDQLFASSQQTLAYCPFHSHHHYLNPTQLFIGVPSQVLSVGNEDVDIRVPDKRSAMHLAYALDHYGINPAWLIGISAAASHLPFVPHSANVSRTIVEHGDWWSTSPQWGTYSPVVWENGPFQMTFEDLALDISALPESLGWTDCPVYASRHWFLRQTASMATYHESVVSREAWRAIHSAMVHAHVLHTATSLLPGLRWGDGNAEIEAVSVARQWGLGSEEKLGFAMQVCNLVDIAQVALDIPIYSEDIVEFVRLLHDGDAQAPFWRDEDIDWASLLSDAMAAFEVLGSRRAARNPELDPQQRNQFISLRYDWRLLLAIIRAHLPPRVPLVGRSIGGLHKLYGPVDASLFALPVDDYPSKWCSTAGGFQQLCIEKQQDRPIVVQPTTTKEEVVAAAPTTTGAWTTAVTIAATLLLVSQQ